MSDENRTMETAPATQGQMPETDRGAPLYRPPADIVETGNGVSVQIEMPGVLPDDVDILVEGRVLTVRGRSRTRRPEGYRLVYAEYQEGDYERSFALGQDVDEGRIAAEMRDGVLTLLLPVAEAARARKIQVKAG